jgi:hypothetical protein
MERDFWLALFYDWQGIVSTSGSILLLVIALWFWDRPVPRWMTVGTAILCFIFASRRAWMREHLAKLNAENKVTELTRKSKRSAAEQADYDTVKNALLLLKETGMTALRHIRRHGSLTFGSYNPTLPPGLDANKTLWVFQHCASEGILRCDSNLGNTERTYSVTPTMTRALDEALYDESLLSGGKP